MIPAFDRGSIPLRILTGLSHDGPSLLPKIYGFCGAVDGGQQYFVRQQLTRLTADCKVRRASGDLYSVTNPAAFASEPAEEVQTPEPAPSHEGEGQSPSDVSAETTAPEQPPAADTVSVSGKPQIEAETQPALEETETMQTQTTGRDSRATAKKEKTSSERPKPLKDFIVALLGASDEPMSIEEVTKAAIKNGVTRSSGSVYVTLRTLAVSKKVSRPSTGMYAGAQILYDSEDKRTKKASAASEKPVEKKSAKTEKRVVAPTNTKKKAASDKAKPAIKTARSAGIVKPARKPSPLKALYEHVDAKIAENKAVEKTAAAGICEIDGQVEALKKQRSDLLFRRDTARDNGKKLVESRKRIAGLEAGVAAILKI